MQLELNAELATRYKSKSQMARVVTEDWTARNLFCASCDATSLVQRDANTRAVNFVCRGCGAGYQLKSGTRLGQRIPDAGFEAMIAAIRSDHVPNLLLMHYVPQWRVRNLIVIPAFCFTEAVIERRKPLGATARRAGWVGCNIQLGAIPPEGKFSIVREGIPVDPSYVRRQYEQVRPIGRLGVELRGWSLAVLNFVHRLGKQQFDLVDLYALESEIGALYPKNRNVRAKIRQQLQVLRDIQLIDFLGRGVYALRRTR